MKSFLKILFILIPFFGLSQTAKSNDVIISKADLDKALTITEIIPTFPKDKTTICEITAKANGKPIVLNVIPSKKESVDELKAMINMADANTYVFVDVKSNGKTYSYRIKLKG